MSIPGGLISLLITSAKTAIAKALDQYLGLTSALIRSNSAGSTQLNTFVDSSTNAVALTTAGSAYTNTFSPFASQGFSNSFDGSSGYLAPQVGTPTFTGNFTIEAWAYDTGATTYGTIFGWRTIGTWVGFLLQRTSTGNLTCSINNNTANIAQSSGTYLTNQWNHVAITRSGSTITLWINGVSAGTSTVSGTISVGTNVLNIGSDPGNRGPTTYLNGYVSNFRVVNGTAVYTTAFTPPTVPLTAITGTSLLTCQSNMLIDNSTNNFAVTQNGTVKVVAQSPFAPSAYNASVNGSSVALNGSTDYITANVLPSEIAFGSGAFTVEAWVYQTNATTGYSGGYQQIVGQNAFGVATNCAFYMGLQSGKPQMSWTNTASSWTVNSTASTAIPLNAWTHMAMVSTGTNLSLYVNGVSVLSTAISGSMNVTTLTLRIGADSNGSGWVNGYVSDVRIVKGTAVYTTTFTPPTAPLTAISNTQLFLSGAAGLKTQTAGNNKSFVDSSSYMNNVTAVGTPTMGTLSPYSVDGVASGGSMYFNGTTDYLTVPDAPQLQFQSAYWTMECWFFTPTTPGSSLCLVTKRANTSTYSGPDLYLNGTQVAFIASTNGTSWNISITTGTILVNAWNHIAVTCNNYVYTLWVNGVSAGTTTIAGAIASSNAAFTIGAGAANGGTFSPVNTYLTDLRIVSGAALYTSAFTPNTAPLTATSNTVLLLSGTNQSVTDAVGKNTIKTIGSSGASMIQHKFANGSIKFNGTTDYLTIPSTGDLIFGSSDFTVECWVEPGAAVASVIFDMRPSGVNGIYPCLGITATGQLQLYINSAALITTTMTLLQGVWSHIAISRQNGTMRLFINGLLVGSVADTNVYLCGSPVIIGAASYSVGSSYFNGYLDDFRVTKGVARYVTDFALDNVTSSDPLVSSSSSLASAGLPTATVTTLNNNMFIDTSLLNNTLTATGTPIQGTFSPFEANWSGYFGGADYLTVASNAAFNVGSSDFTLECWVNAKATGSIQYIWDSVSGGWRPIMFGISATGAVWVDLSGGSSYIASGTSTSTIVNNAWNHVALVRYGSNITIYVNGVANVVTTTLSGALMAMGAPLIGTQAGTPTLYMNGYISNLRFVSGTAVYTSAFTPPTSPLTAISGTALLTLQSNSFKDNSANNLAITSSGTPSVQPISPFANSSTYTQATNGGSTYFNGTSAFLSFTGAPSLSFPGALTIEFWYYPTASLTNAGIFDGRTSATSTTGIMFRQGDNSSNGLAFCAYWNNGTTVVYGGQNMKLNAWNHCAAVRSATGVITLYVNGVGGTTATYATALTDGATSTWYVGKFTGTVNAGNYTTGYISNLRAVNGTAIYTANFTPPTAPLTPVANTVMLLPGTSSGVVDYTGQNNITTVGTASASYGLSPFAGVGNYSVYLSSSSLTVTGTSTAGTGSFTMECWINPIGTQNNGVFINTRSGNTSDGVDVSLTSANQIHITYSGTVLYTGTVSVTNNAWTHIAVVRNGSSSYTVYRNGVVDGTFTNSTNFTSTVASVGSPSSASSMTGYVSNARVVNGTAVYTSAFTPPTTPLTAISGTVLLTCQNNRFVDNSSSHLTITVTGTPTIQNNNPFTSTPVSSLSFNGTTDYLSVPYTPQLNLSAGNFTIEAWAYWTGTNGYATIINKDGVSGSAESSYALQLNNSGYAMGSVGSGNSTSYDQLVTSSVIMPVDAWVHLAFVKNGTTLTLYQNGISVASATQTGTIVDGGKPLLVGYQTGQPANNYWSGNIAGVRITQGTARYTSNFTPATTALPTNSGSDSYWNQTTLLLQGDVWSSTEYVASNNIVLDSSVYNFPITRTGTPTQGTFSPFSNNGWSNYFNGSSAYLTNTTNATISNFGTSNYTFEVWLYPTASQSAEIYDGRNTSGNGTQFVVTLISQYPGVYYNGAQLATATSQLPLNAWSHVAISRWGTSANQACIFVNGAPVTYFTDASSYTQTYNYIGTSAFTTNGAPYAGYMSNMRITKAAVYTSTFTVPTAPLTAITGTTLLTCQSNKFADNSTNNIALSITGTPMVQAFSPFAETTYNAAINGGSLYVNGSSYMLAPTSSQFIIGTNNFTVEYWIYPLSFSGGPTVVDSRTSGDGTEFSDNYTTGGAPGIYTNTQIATSSITAPANAWSHIAFSRNNGNLQIFVNGVSGYSAANSTVFGSTPGTIRVGANVNLSAYFNGYVSNVRVINGTGIYTSAFTPPTAPLTTVTNTVMLLSGTNAGLYDVSSYSDVVTAGNARTMALTTKFSNSVMMNGTTDYMILPYTPAYVLGTGNFTIEMWANFTSVSASCLLDMRPSGVQGLYPTLYVSSGVLTYLTNNAVAITGATLTTGTWYHIALSRYNGITKMFINGVQTGSSYTDTNSYLCPAVPGVTIGAYGYAASGYMSGYIEDVRITQGIARYITGFAPYTSKLGASIKALPSANTQYDATTQSYTGDPYYDNVALLMHFDGSNGTNQIVDRKGNTITVTGATLSTVNSKSGPSSGYFNGASYVSAPTAACTLGTGNFTIECWVYLTSIAGTPEILDMRPASAQGLYPTLFLSSGVLTYFTNNANAITGSTLSTNTWYHIALSRYNGLTAMYVNGTQVGSTYTDSNNYICGATGAIIGAGYASLASINDFISGYIDEFRITKGVARYTSNFTPATTEFPDNRDYTADQYSNVSSTVKVIGTSTAVNNTFIDSSTNNFAITTTGNPARGTFSPFSNAGWSNNFNGTTDYLSVPNSTALNLSSGNFTIEAWVYYMGTNVNGQIVQKGGVSGVQNVSFELGMISGYAAGIVGGGSSNYQPITSSVALPTTQWIHLAFVKNGTTLTLYQNGINVASATQTTTIIDASAATLIGYQTSQPSTFYWNGFISNLRIVKGTAVYTSAFTPPTTALSAISGTSLLTCQANSFVDSSTNNATLTPTGTPWVDAFSPFAYSTYNASTNGGSMYFNGSGNYLATPTSAALELGNTYTVECWCYRTSNTTTGTYTGTLILATTNAYSTTVTGFMLSFDGGALNFRDSSSGAGILQWASATTNIPLNTWAHIAVVRNGSGTNTISMYVNGVKVVTANCSNAQTTANTVIVGGDGTANCAWPGYISNMRVVPGTAVYTSAFTPPTAPLTPVTGTALLLSGTNAQAIDKSGKNVIGAKAVVATNAQRKYATNTYYNGTSSYAYIPHDPKYNFGTGNFTVECWFNTSTVASATYGIISKCLASSSNFAPFAIDLVSGNTVGVYMSTTGSSWDLASGTSAGTVTANTWNHVALVRNGSTFTLYLNGIGTVVATSASALLATTTPILIGACNYTTIFQFFNGFIEDVRITPGVARYLGNFTVPLAPFPV